MVQSSFGGVQDEMDGALRGLNSQADGLVADQGNAADKLVGASPRNLGLHTS